MAAIAAVSAVAVATAVWRGKVSVAVEGWFSRCRLSWLGWCNYLFINFRFRLFPLITSSLSCFLLQYWKSKSANVIFFPLWFPLILFPYQVCWKLMRPVKGRWFKVGKTLAALHQMVHQLSGVMIHLLQGCFFISYDHVIRNQEWATIHGAILNKFSGFSYSSSIGKFES